MSGLLSDINWHLPFLIYLIGLALVPLLILNVVEPSRTISAHPVPVVQRTEHAPIGTLLGIYAIMSTTMLLFFFVPVQLPFYLHGVMHTNAVQSGIALAAANLCTGLVALSYRRIDHRFSRMSLIALGFVGLGAGLMIIGVAHVYLLTVAGAFLAGSAAGIVLPTLGLWIMDVTPLAVRGRALSGLTSAIFLGQFLSPFVSQPLGQYVGLDMTFLGAGGGALGLALLFMLFQWQFVSLRIQCAHG